MALVSNFSTETVYETVTTYAVSDEAKADLASGLTVASSLCIQIGMVGLAVMILTNMAMFTGLSMITLIAGFVAIGVILILGVTKLRLGKWIPSMQDLIG